MAPEQMTDPSFVERLREYWDLQDAWSSTFMKYPQRCRVVDGRPGWVRFEFVVTRDTLNSAQTLHGGCVATILDVCMPFALWEDLQQRDAVTLTVSMNVLYYSFLSAPRLDETLEIDVFLQKRGAQLAFLSSIARRKEDGMPMATGRQTVMIMPRSRALSKSAEASGIVTDKFKEQIELPLNTFPVWNEKMKLQVLHDHPEVAELNFYETSKELWEHPAWHNGFQKYPARCKLVEARPGIRKFEFLVTDDVTNPAKLMHGGALMTIIDSCTSGTSVNPLEWKLKMSVDLTVNFVGVSTVGETLVLETNNVLYTDTICCYTAHVYRKSDGQLVAYGKQTMMTVDMERFLQKAKM